MHETDIMKKLLHFHCKAATHSVMQLKDFQISNTDWQSGHIYHLSELVYIIFTQSTNRSL
jgi:hypothetical protein